jgi:uncharacterized protein YegP (UPF0339 family)
MAKHRIEVFEGANGWYWRARHLATSHIICDGSEAYSTKSNARRAARRVGRMLIFAPVVNLTPSHSNGDYRRG